MNSVNRVRKDRTIRHFTPPLLTESSYSDTDFSPSVRNACLANRTGTVGSSSPSIPGPSLSAGLKFATSTPAHLSGVAPSPMIGVSPIESQQHGGEMAHSTDSSGMSGVEPFREKKTSARRNGGAYSTVCGKQEWALGGSVGLGQCEHEPLEKPREDYLTPGEAPHSALMSITMDNMEYYVNFRLKVSKMIVVGDVSVGKTSLVNRFCHECFDRDYKATIGVDFEVERFDILSVPFNLQIWDTAGQERFRCIAAAYYRGAHVVVIVFDLMDPYSLESVTRWHEEAVRENRDGIHLFLVGTKKDLCSRQQFLEADERGFKMAQQIQAEYWTVSSLSGENVDNFFFRIACITFNAAVKREVEDMELKSQVKKISAAGGSNLIKLDKPSHLDASMHEKDKCSC